MLDFSGDEGENPGNCRPVSWNESSTFLLIHEYQKNILNVEQGIIKYLVNVMKDYIVYQKDQREAAFQRQETMHEERMWAFIALRDVLKSFAYKK